MRRTIAIVDLASGEVTDRTSNTPTLDVPADFDRTTTASQLDAGAHLHYAASGQAVVRPAFSRPLSWRVCGEECLVQEEDGPAAPGSTRFRLSAVERPRPSTLSQTFARPHPPPPPRVASARASRSRSAK